MLRAKRLADGSTTGPLESEIWLDVESPSPEELESIKPWGLNPLSLADAREIGHWSRFEHYPEHLFLILRTLEPPHNSKSRTERVSYFYFPERRALITFRNEPVEYLEAEWGSFKGGSSLALWQRLLDRGVETFFDYLESLYGRVDDLEEEAVAGDQTELPRKVFSLRREVLYTRRLSSQARDALVRLEREPSLGADAYLFRDLTDRMGRVYEGLDAARDVLAGALEVHLSAQNNKLNLVVQRLTVISTLLLPLTLWAGIYGTNFKTFSEYDWASGRAFFWGGLVVIGATLAIWMKRKGWW